MVFIADKAFTRIKATIRNLTPRQSPRTFTDVIVEVNAALRGWTYYFRHAIADTTLLVPALLHVETNRGLAT